METNKYLVNEPFLPSNPGAVIQKDKELRIMFSDQMESGITYAVLGVGDLDPLCLCLVESSDWYQSHLSVSPSKNYDQLLLL